MFSQVDASLKLKMNQVEEYREEYDKLLLTAQKLNDGLAESQSQNDVTYANLLRESKTLEEQKKQVKQHSNEADKKKSLLEKVRTRVKQLENETRSADSEKLDWQKKLKDIKEQVGHYC